MECAHLIGVVAVFALECADLVGVVAVCALERADLGGVLVDCALECLLEVGDGFVAFLVGVFLHGQGPHRRP